MNSSPEFSKSQVNKAGEILVSGITGTVKFDWALQVLSNWRASHIYPINTFQSTLRRRLKNVDKKALVAQRLKRLPSIIYKLKRFESMKLSRMQDIGGLRAVMSSLAKVNDLQNIYKNPGLFQHALVSSKDYITKPKADGYRGIHLIFKYKNRENPAYDDLHLELQIRTKLQHYWATAVETMGAFLNQALKSGEGTAKWKEFFAITSSAFAIVEKTNLVEKHKNYSEKDIFKLVAKQEEELDVLKKLRGFAIATDHISRNNGKGYYNLIILNFETKRLRVIAYTRLQLDQANADYEKQEELARQGENIEAVLVAAGPIETLKKAYPNYFLDTQSFISEVKKIKKNI